MLPSLRKYQKRLKLLKEYQRLIDEMERTKSEWMKNPVLSRRNSLLLKRNSSYLQVSAKVHSINVFFLFTLISLLLSENESNEELL